MTTPVAVPRARPAERAHVFRNSIRDAWFFVALAGHAALVIGWPSVFTVALTLWWTANSTAHHFIHRPFFTSRSVNHAFSVVLSVFLGVPQSVWRERHCAHHAGRRPRVRVSRLLVVEVAALAALWGALFVFAPGFLAFGYLPGIALGLALCAVQGHYEHPNGAASVVDHHGRLYNWIFFNDGYHTAHHHHPGCHWSELSSTGVEAQRVSRWPAVLRWIEEVPIGVPDLLDRLERVVIGNRVIERWLVERHSRALRALRPHIGGIERITIVGGGLFPRSAIVCARIFPHARITLVDLSAENLRLAKATLREWGVEGEVESEVRAYEGKREDADLVLLPLAYRGDREALYSTPPARFTLVHDWVWRRRGVGRSISWALGKRLNLVRRP